MSPNPTLVYTFQRNSHTSHICSAGKKHLIYLYLTFNPTTENLCPFHVIFKRPAQSMISDKGTKNTMGKGRFL